MGRNDKEKAGIMVWQTFASDVTLLKDYNIGKYNSKLMQLGSRILMENELSDFYLLRSNT